MKPSEKSKSIAELLQEMARREAHILANTCVQPPMGCGNPVDAAEFLDEASKKEFTISGLRQVCQNNFFLGE